MFGSLFGMEAGFSVEMYVFCADVLWEFLLALSVGICCGNCVDFPLGFDFKS